MNEEPTLDDQVQALKKQAGKVATALNQGTRLEALEEAIKLDSLSRELFRGVQNELHAVEEEKADDDDDG